MLLQQATTRRVAPARGEVIKVISQHFAKHFWKHFWVLVVDQNSRALNTAQICDQLYKAYLINFCVFCFVWVSCVFSVSGEPSARATFYQLAGKLKYIEGECEYLCKYQSEYPQPYPYPYPHTQTFTTRYLFRSGRTRSTFHILDTLAAKYLDIHINRNHFALHMPDRSIGHRYIYVYINIYA